MLDPGEERVSASHPDAWRLVSRALTNLLDEVEPSRRVCVLCIGTDRSTGDSLGPLVGTELRREPRVDAVVIGHLDRPLHAANMIEELSVVSTITPQPVVIAVDACLGSHDQVGTVVIGRGPLRPGAGVNKCLPPVGDIYVTGTVNVGGFMEYLVLQNTRLGLVFSMANVIARGLRCAIASYTLGSATARDGAAAARGFPGIL